MTTQPHTGPVPGTTHHGSASSAESTEDNLAAGPASVFHTMGTVVSFRAPPPVRAALTTQLQEIFWNHDRRFSFYRPDSELSQIGTGRLLLSRSSAELREMYALAVEWRNATDGLFDPHGPDGRLDLNGVVKAHAIQQAGHYLQQQGVPNWSLNCGGDILCSGEQSPGTPWVIGVGDPEDKSAILTSITTSPDRMAVATSGVSERGHHIWSRTGEGKVYRPIVQVSVSAADILTADVLATAIWAGGTGTVQDMAQRFTVDVLVVEEDGATDWVSGRRPVSLTAAEASDALAAF